MLPLLTPDRVETRRCCLDNNTIEQSAAIVAEVRTGGESALRANAERFDELAPRARLWLDHDALEEAWRSLPATTRDLLSRVAGRIREFAELQRACLVDFRTQSGGVECGHECVPVERAGCYAPGGRYPLPSSVLMTAVSAKVAGVQRVVVASPRPRVETLAAAFLAGADGLLPVGGAHAIAALAYGVGAIAPCDVVVGPGNRFVTAAKHVVSRDVGIDMLAGPSELVVVADASADPALVAADLLAQAEHDPDAMPILVTTDEDTVARVRRAAGAQLSSLATADTARIAMAAGGAVVCADLDEAAAVCDRLAPEHLALHLRDAKDFAQIVSHYGAIFVGSNCAEVLGDYGIGPNHVLPTGGQARHTGGLSVFTFLCIRTFVRALPGQDANAALRDARDFAQLEGLSGHAESARRRIVRQPGA